MNAIGNVIFSPWIRGIDKQNVEAAGNYALVEVKRNTNHTWVAYGRKITYIEANNTQNEWVMLGDPVGQVAFRLFTLALVTPFYIGMRGSYYLVKTALYLAWSVAAVFIALGRSIKGDQASWDWLKEKSLQPLKEGCFAFARTIHYGIGMELAALMGLLSLDPLKGRVRFGLLERKLNGDVTYRECMKEPLSGFYIASCMQPIVEDTKRKCDMPVCTPVPKEGWKIDPAAQSDQFVIPKGEKRQWRKVIIKKGDIDKYMPDGYSESAKRALKKNLFLQKGDRSQNVAEGYQVRIKKSDIEQKQIGTQTMEYYDIQAVTTPPKGGACGVSCYDPYFKQD